MSEVALLVSDPTITLIIAGIATVISKWLKQPVILGYIVAGIMAGPSISLVLTISDPTNIKMWADIGVILLLFATRLDFSFKKLVSVGVAVAVATVTIVRGMMFIGYIAGNVMGLSHISSIFLGGMLSMLSTAIVFKAFNDMGFLQQKFTGIVLGILIIEDLVAVVMVVVLSTLAAGKHFEGKKILESILKLAVFLIFWLASGIYLIPTLLKKIRHSTSSGILLITPLGLHLGVVTAATKAGFSAALGAFVMESLLAETVGAERIVHIIQPTKDLLASIFFASVRMIIDPTMMWEHAIPIPILILLALSGQVLFGSFNVLLSGQPLKIAVQSGFSLTQVDEFAFIIASSGVSLSVTDKYLHPIIVAASVMMTFFIPYMIWFSKPAYQFIDIHISESLKDYLVHYTPGAITVKHQGTWHKLIRSVLVSVTLYLVVYVFFITLYFSYTHPLIRRSLPGMEGNLLGFIIVLLVTSPFLWAIIMKRNSSAEFHKLWTDNKFNRGPLVPTVLVKILIYTITMTSTIIHLFNVTLGAGLVVFPIIIAVIYLSRRVKKRSLTIERQPMANFQRTDGNGLLTESDTSSIFGNSIPSRELHSMGFTVSPDSIYMGRTLKESSLRTLFQIDMISVTRGEKHPSIPQGGGRLYPYDEIAVVGAGWQLESFRTSMEQKKIGGNGNGTSLQDEMEIGQLPVEGGSPLIGETIREADISDSIIIEIERSIVNIMNPDPDTIFKENDTVWTVDKRKIIEGLNKD